MRRLIPRIFDTSKYASAVDKDRALLIYGMIGFVLVGYLIFVLTIRGNVTSTSTIPPIVSDAIFLVVGFGTIGVTRSGRLQLGAVGPLLTLYAGALFPSVLTGYMQASSAVILPLFLVLTGLLYRERGLVVGTLLTLGTFGAGILFRANLANPPTQQTNLTDLFSVGLSLIALSIFTYVALRGARLSRMEGEARVTEERIKLAQITSQTARRISSRMALNDVLTNAVEQIRENYPHIYHAQIFMVDEGSREAKLAASTGQIGQFLMQRAHSLHVGSLSVIGQVTLTGEPLIARANDPNSIHRRNEALPATAVEAAFPLRIGDRVIGALDLQSQIVSTFHQEDIPAFQSLADHIAVAIDNARLFEETEARLEENQQLVEQARSAVREVERLNRQLTGRAWADYLYGKADQLSRSVDFASNTTHDESAWTQTLTEAIQYNYVAQNQTADAQVIAIPIRVRGQVIGAIEFELDKESSLSPEDLALIQEVGERFGLAAENTRLFEQSQRIAQREALVNEIGVRLQASNNIETTLAEAARSLKQTLRADKVAIRLGTPPAGNGNGGAQGA